MWGSGSGRDTFYCPSCDYVAKARCMAVCPFCEEPMLNMGSVWRSGKKGSRTRLWNRRVTLRRMESGRRKGHAWVSQSGVTEAWIRRRIHDKV